MSPSRPDSQAGRAAAFGARIRQLRRARKLSQREAARKILMTQPNLSRLENGLQGPPDDETILRLATAFDGDVDELMALAGRRGSGEDFETRVLEELAALRREVAAI